MTVSLSKRSLHIKQADIRSMSIECEKVGGINLAQGVCDTIVPIAIRRAAQAAIDNGVNSYSRYDGLSELRRAIARKVSEFNGIQVDPEEEVIVSAGSTGAFYCTCMALLDPGDEVIVFEPFYGYHINTLLTVGGVPKYVTLRGPTWTFSREGLELAITPKTKAILVNTPANPSGKVFNRTELTWIADCAREHDLFVFTDEIYEHYLYDGRQHISPASLPGMWDRTITISGFSKTYSITGWRIGYSISHPRWSQMIGYVNDLIYVCAPSPLQAGVATGMLALGPAFYAELRAQYEHKRKQLCDALGYAGLSPCNPEGAYYVLADVSRLKGSTSKEKTMCLLSRTGIAGVPGEAFFRSPGRKQFVRLCFAKTDAELESACQRLRQLQ